MCARSHERGQCFPFCSPERDHVVDDAGAGSSRPHCERALADFEAAITTPSWRTRWAAVVALLRAVGHVLHKVDKPAGNVQIQQVIDAAWQTLKKLKRDSHPSIFWHFIDDERNNVLKAYAFSAHQNTTVHPGTPWFNRRTGESGSSGGGPNTYIYFMRSGPFKGRDPLDLCREAITFWRDYLNAIDRP